MAAVSFCKLLGTESVKSEAPVKRLYNDKCQDAIDVVDHILLSHVHQQGLVLVTNYGLVARRTTDHPPLKVRPLIFYPPPSSSYFFLEMPHDKNMLSHGESKLF